VECVGWLLADSFRRQFDGEWNRHLTVAHRRRGLCDNARRVGFCCVEQGDADLGRGRHRDPLEVADGAGDAQATRRRPAVVTGSRTLVHTLMTNDLVDEYRFMIFPVAVGLGLRLFPETPEKTVLEPTGTQTFDSGVVVNTYAATR
jgi:RibD C-terminal domain